MKITEQDRLMFQLGSNAVDFSGCHKITEEERNRAIDAAIKRERKENKKRLRDYIQGTIKAVESRPEWKRGRKSK